MWHALFAGTTGSIPREHAGKVGILDVGSAARAATQLEGDEDPVVLVGCRTDSHAIRVVCTYIAANQPGRLVAHAETTHAPLAALAALETSYELGADPAHALSAWRDVLGHTWSGAVLSSVARLTDPNPTMRQHMVSWLPSSRFVLRQGPEAEAVTVSKLDLLLTGLGRGETDMLVSEHAMNDDVTRQIVRTVAPATVRPAMSVGDWSRLYGTREQFQIALLPTAPQRFVRPPGEPCLGCGFSSSEESCDFCNTRSTTRVLTGEAV